MKQIVADVLFTASLLTPAIGFGEEHHRYYDRERKDYHHWDDREDARYRRWQEGRHQQYRDFYRLHRRDQSEYWIWRHSHPEDDDRDRDHR